MTAISPPIIALVVLVTGVSACRCDRGSPPPPTRAQTEAFDLERVTLTRSARGSSDDLSGLSGMTIDDAGTVWAVPEDDRWLTPLAFFDRPHLKPDLPLRGVPEDWDTESLAWLGGQRFAFGTERDDERDSDLILIAEVSNGAVEVKERIEVPYAPWGVTPTANHGIEGLCAVKPLLLLATENVGIAAARRFAPLASYNLETGALTYYRLWLTSDSGRISSLVCRRTDRGVEAIAIERHYGVGRLITFVWPSDGRQAIEPTLLIDLVPHFFPLPNYEGLVWRDDGTILILADNDSGGITGPNELLVLTPRRAAAVPSSTP